MRTAASFRRTAPALSFFRRKESTASTDDDTSSAGSTGAGASSSSSSSTYEQEEPAYQQRPREESYKGQRKLRSLWEAPLFEQMPFFKFWKSAGTNASTTSGSFAKDMPRTIHGYHEMMHPKSDQPIRWYPYRNELTVGGAHKPTVSQALAKDYFPAMLDDDQRVAYVAAKSGRPEEDVAQELFRMRRLRLAIAQSMRNKLKGQWVRMPEATWNSAEREYLNATVLAAQAFGLDFYNSNSLDPYVMYSPHFMLGDYCDMIFNKQVRTHLQYVLCEVVIHNTIPCSRLPGVKGACKAPLDKLEPCLLEFYRVKLSIMALFAKAEAYVVDHNFDGGHTYNGALVHLRRGVDPFVVEHEIVPLDLDLRLAQDWLNHYYQTNIAEKGLTGIKY